MLLQAQLRNFHRHPSLLFQRNYYRRRQYHQCQRLLHHSEDHHRHQHRLLMSRLELTQFRYLQMSLIPQHPHHHHHRLHWGRWSQQRHYYPGWGM